VAIAMGNLEAGEVIQEEVDSLKKNIKLNQDVPLDINLV
jgi:altronate dehydratase small subunit